MYYNIIIILNIYHSSFTFMTHLRCLYSITSCLKAVTFNPTPAININYNWRIDLIWNWISACCRVSKGKSGHNNCSSFHSNMLQYCDIPCCDDEKRPQEDKSCRCVISSIDICQFPVWRQLKKH